MLEDMAQEGDDSIVSWRPHGKAFTVHRPDEFVEKIMPYYFKQSRYKSFQRQLNLYGFVCLPRGDDKGSYFHKNFARGERYLCHYIVRKKDQRSTPRTSAAKKQKMEEAQMKKETKLRRRRKGDNKSNEDMKETEAGCGLDTYGCISNSLWESGLGLLTDKSISLVSGVVTDSIMNPFPMMDEAEQDKISNT